jgi:hypothetical protein
LTTDVLFVQVIQLGAVRFISTLFATTDCVQSFSCETTYFAPDNQEVWGVISISSTS